IGLGGRQAKACGKRSRRQEAKDPRRARKRGSLVPTFDSWFCQFCILASRLGGFRGASSGDVHESKAKPRSEEVRRVRSQNHSPEVWAWSPSAWPSAALTHNQGKRSGNQRCVRSSPEKNRRDRAEEAIASLRSSTVLSFQAIPPRESWTSEKGTLPPCTHL